MRSFHNTVRKVSKFIIENTTFSCDGFSSDQVVSCYHSNLDTSVLASLDSKRYFRSDNILDTNDANEDISSLLNIIETFSVLNGVVLGAALARFQVSVSERDSSQGLAGIVGDCLKETLLDAIGQGGLLSLLVKVEATLVENDFSRALHVHSAVVSMLSFATVVNNGRHSLTLGCELKADKVLMYMLGSVGNDILSNSIHEDKHSLFSGRGMLNSA